MIVCAAQIADSSTSPKGTLLHDMRRRSGCSFAFFEMKFLQLSHMTEAICLPCIFPRKESSKNFERLFNTRGSFLLRFVSYVFVNLGVQKRICVALRKVPGSI